MKSSEYWLKWFLPGVVFILLAFWAGTMKSLLFAFLGFLSFFLIGVALIIEGRKRSHNGQRTTHNDESLR